MLQNVHIVLNLFLKFPHPLGNFLEHTRPPLARNILLQVPALLVLELLLRAQEELQVLREAGLGLG